MDKIEVSLQVPFIEKNITCKSLDFLVSIQDCARGLLSAAERRGTPVLLSVSVSDNSGNSPQMAAPRRSREIDQSKQRFQVVYDNRCLLANEYGR